MSAAKRKSVPPGPQALAYGSALRSVYERQGRSQKHVSSLIPVAESSLSRYFSGQLVAGRPHLEGLIRVVRGAGGAVSDEEVAELHKLRKAAQEVSSSQTDRVAILQEQMGEVKALLGTLPERLREVESDNGQLTEQVDRLLSRVQQEEKRADDERRLRLEERPLRERAEARAKQAEWGAEEAAARLADAARLSAESQQRAAGAELAAEMSAAALAESRRQLVAAAGYAKESDAVLAKQREQLRSLRLEVTTLRRQVRKLSGEADPVRSEGIAGVATQVSAVHGDQVADVAGTASLDEATARPGGAEVFWGTGLEDVGDVAAIVDDESEWDAGFDYFSGTSDKGGRPGSSPSVEEPPPGPSRTAQRPGSGSRSPAGAGNGSEERAGAAVSPPNPTPEELLESLGGRTGHAAAARRKAASGVEQSGSAAATPPVSHPLGARPPYSFSRVPGSPLPGERAVPRPKTSEPEHIRRTPVEGWQARERDSLGLSDGGGGGRAQQRREAERRRAARPFQEKVIPYVQGYGTTFAGAQVVAFAGHVMRLVWQADSLDSFRIFSVMFCVAVVAVFTFLGAYFATFRKYAILTLFTVELYFILALAGMDNATLPYVTEKAEKLASYIVGHGNGLTY
ncbi:hypothetical protein OID55_41495 (plasmid) [Streptomyces sp. NBC_00715]|uniref:hypothetical protein n=1 Tax=Streptomyces sp. NBC_00715 TaxID=2975811 RepID=UPI0038668E01